MSNREKFAINEILEKEFNLKLKEDYDKSNLSQEVIEYVESFFEDIRMQVPFIESSREAVRRLYKEMEDGEITFGQLTSEKMLISADSRISFAVAGLLSFCSKNNIDWRNFIEKTSGVKSCQ